MRCRKSIGSILDIVGQIIRWLLLLVVVVSVPAVAEGRWDSSLSMQHPSSSRSSVRRAAAQLFQKQTIRVPAAPSVCRIAESVWRAAAESNQVAVYELLRPGLLDPKHSLNSGIGRHRSKDEQVAAACGAEGPERDAATTTITNNSSSNPRPIWWTALNPQHPVYNFLIEYYGQKGVKSVRRLAQWSPAPHSQGVLLEGATDADLTNDLLFLRGAMLRTDGIEYNPVTFFAAKTNYDEPTPDNQQQLLERAAAPFLWNRSVLERTLHAEPVWHCYGLHEWAMQYQPMAGAPPPPAAQYQSHLPLRVSQTMINETVERKGVHCTHVDAWRFFAPASLPLHHYHTATSTTTDGAPALSFSRSQQLQLEQPACVHANMDLLKYALRLRPFIDADLVRRALAVALHARTLDVAASPYNASDLYGVTAIPVETAAGRAEYRHQQITLHRDCADPVRRELLQTYTNLLDGAFPGMLTRPSSS